MRERGISLFLNRIFEVSRLIAAYLEGVTEDAFLVDARTQQAVGRIC